MLMTWLCCCHSQTAGRTGQGAAGRLAEPRGLAFNEAKTKIVPLSRGSISWDSIFAATASKLLIKPGSRPSRVPEKARGGIRMHCAGPTSMAILAKISPDHHGAGRPTTGGGVVQAVQQPWTITCGSYSTNGPCWSHPNKPKSWIVGRYFGKFNKFRNDSWVFGRDSGTYLTSSPGPIIVRHAMVKGGASPDDPGLAGTGPQRRKGQAPAG